MTAQRPVRPRQASASAFMRWLRHGSPVAVLALGLVALVLLGAADFFDVGRPSTPFWGLGRSPGPLASEESSGRPWSGHIRLRAQRLSPVPSQPPGEPLPSLSPLQSPYRLVLDQLTAARGGPLGSGAGANTAKPLPFGLTQALGQALDSMAIKLAVCLRYRAETHPREPLAYELLLTPRSSALRVVSLPQNQSATRSAEMVCLRDTLEQLRSESLAQATQDVPQAMRARVFVVLVSPGVMSE